MISRIACILLFCSWVSAQADQPYSSFVSDEKDGRRYFKIDLTAKLPEADWQTIWKGLDAERSASSLTSSRRAEVDMAQAQLLLSKERYEEAANLLARIDSAGLLGDAALFYRARALHLSATQLSVTPCREARELLIQLYNFPSGPFHVNLADEIRTATRCLVKGLVTQNQLQRTHIPLLYTVEADPLLNDKDREDLLSAMLPLLDREGRKEEAQILADEAVRLFPKNKEFKKWQSDSSPATAGFSAASELEPPQGGKKRPQPEEELLQKAIKRQKEGKKLPSVEILVQIARDYPGSMAAEKATPRLKVMAGSLLASKSRSSFIKLAKKLPFDPLYDLSQSILADGFDKDAEELFHALLDNFPPNRQFANVLFALGRIHEDRQEWEAARQKFGELVEKYSSDRFFNRAHFKLGWLSYVMKDDSKAAEWLEYDRALQKDPSGIAQDLYWLSRVAERMGNSTRTKQLSDQIAQTAPLSYYALLADRLAPVDESIPAKSAFPSLQYDSAFRVRRARTFLAAGLLSAASYVLRQIDLEADPAATLETATLLYMARDFGGAIQAIPTSNLPGAKLPSAWGAILFPVAFEEVIRNEAKNNSLDPLLLFSLIKQESAYREDAESRSGALGLMQLMPKTARQVAQSSKEEVPAKNDLLLSSKNVSLGARYIKQQLTTFQGNLAYALAAYNAGPIVTTKWVNQWKSLPTEVFIELIPYEETRNYVKSILRNYAFYAQLLERKRIVFSDMVQIK